MWLAVEGAAAQPPVTLLYLGQAVTLAVAVAAGWFALRTKRVDVDDQRRARFDARIDKEFDEALQELAAARRDLTDANRRLARYERYLIYHGIDLESGRREAADG